MFFGGLSIFRRAAAIQLLNKAAGALGADCALCGSRSAGALVCEGCERSLPRTLAACPRCALPMPGAQTCGRCLRGAPAFGSALAAFEYRFPVDRLVQRFKFAGDLATGRWLAESLARHVGDSSADLLVAPPITRAGLARRGFNQAVEIARVVGRARAIRVEPRAFAKLRDTTPQPRLGGRARRMNLRGAFRCDLAVEGLHVAIVDDVMTTGATAEELSRTLLSAGAARVSVWCVARTPEPGD